MIRKCSWLCLLGAFLGTVLSEPEEPLGNDHVLVVSGNIQTYNFEFIKCFAACLVHLHVWSVTPAAERGHWEERAHVLGHQGEAGRHDGHGHQAQWIL